MFATTRMGFKEEATYTDAPQPYGGLFVMRYDGAHPEQLADNQWEDGTAAIPHSFLVPAGKHLTCVLLKIPAK